MLTLITNAEVFAPRPIGHKQILVAGERVAAIADEVDVRGSEVKVVDARGGYVVPGLVDVLTHPCGGGGEGGYHNRTEEVDFGTFVEAGVTTPVGALGTDSITRGLEVLYGNVMGLRGKGLDAYMYTGSYRVPSNTMTGDITRDIVLVDPVLGVGEVAISDHRSSQPTTAELRRTAADARLGGIVNGEGGTVLVHVGDGRSRLEPIRRALRDSDLPPSSFYPTHVNRNPDLLDEAFDYALSGGNIDITVSTVPQLVEDGEVPALEALREAIDASVPVDRISLSSDAGGSLPVYRDGELIGLEAARPDVLLSLLQGVLREDPVAAEPVLAALSENPAKALGIHDSGRVAVGCAANLLILDSNSCDLSGVVCKGQWLMRRESIH